MKRAIVFACIVLCAQMCLATTIHVPADQPTIQAGISAAVNGDTVLVSPGVYTGDINFMGRRILLTSEAGPAQTILRKCTVTFKSFEDSTSVMESFSVNGKAQCFLISNSCPIIRNCDISQCTGTAFSVTESGAKIRNNAVHDCGGFVDFSSGHVGFEISGNKVFNNANVICSIHSDYAIIDHNVIYDNGGRYVCGIEAYDCVDCEIVNNTLVGNSVGIISDWPYAGLHIRNNIVAGSKGDGIWAVASALDHNDAWGNLTGNTPGVGGISAAPLFVDTAARDFRLSSGSPCIDAGNPEAKFNDPDGSRSDIGAYPRMAGYPDIKRISYEPGGEGHFVASVTPIIEWTLVDTAGIEKGDLELQVGIDENWAVAEMWSTGILQWSGNSIVYGGLPLSNRETYYLRIRVLSGSKWSDWYYDYFTVRSSRVCLVPQDVQSIQAGIDAVFVGDTVLISDGHYHERINYRGKNVVVGSYFLRDDDSSHILNTVIDGDTAVLGLSDTASVVVFLSGEDSTAVLAGVTVQNGIGSKINVFPARYEDRHGGGVFCKHASPTISNCRFRNCRANMGGGGLFAASHTQIVHCMFVDNVSEYGGGVVVIGDSSVVQDCIFLRNEAHYGGGAIIYDYSIPIERCEFVDNKAWYEGGGLRISVPEAWEFTASDCVFHGNSADRGGAIFREGWLRLDRCTLTENKATYGGGVLASCLQARKCEFVQNVAYSGGAALLEACHTVEYDTLDSCLFDGNVATSAGGALVLDLCQLRVYRVNSCTFIRNSAPYGAWLRIYMHQGDTAGVAIQNCCVAFNTGGSLLKADGAVSKHLLPSLSCTDVYGNFGGDWVGVLAPQAGINGNISADPLFCDTAAGDFHIQSNSLCAPANNSCGVLIGALPVACGWGCGDADGSGSIDLTDAVYLVSYLFTSGAAPEDYNAGDVNGDGRVNIADVVYLVNYIFLSGPAPCAVVG